MAGRNWRGPKVSQVLPIWTTANTDLNTSIFLSFMARLGVTNFPSYLSRLAVPNFLCALVGAAFGAAYSGGLGLTLGVVLGIAAPAVLIWLAITVVHAAAYLHTVGFRFRLHNRALPGRPDVSLPSRKVAIFVHGCFWHQHPGCSFATTPATRADFWQAKFATNKNRDAMVADKLKSLGWQVLIIWECQTKKDIELDALAWAILAASPDK